MNTKFLRNLLAIGALAVGTAVAKPSNVPVDLSDQGIAARIVHEVRMYPRYTIWDNISVHVVNGQAELDGQVSQPYKKSELGRITAQVAGVQSVKNDLQVLPLSPFDDQLRVRVANAIFRDPVLSRYAIQPVPSIHIIVDNGRVTLEGVVNNETERNIATIRASGAGLSFGQVVNNLRVENPSKHS